MLAFTGVASAVRQLDAEAGALLTTTCGEVLLWKVGLAGSAAMLGAYNRYAALPRLLAALGSARTRSDRHSRASGACSASKRWCCSRSSRWQRR